MDWFIGSKQGEAKRLVAQLADASRREHASRGLIRLGAEAVPVLIESLQTRDVSLLPIYEQLLAQIPSATAALVKTLQSAHPVLRGRAAEVLAISRDRGAAPALLDALQGEYFTVRARAALALGQMGEARATHPLLDALKDREAEVRAAACQALGLLGDPSTFDEIASVLLDDPMIEVRQAAARALGSTGHAAALPYLLEALHDSYWWYEREHAAGDLLTAIETMGAAAVEPLIEALGDKEGTVRKFAAALLGRLGDPRATEPLGMALYDMHHEVGKTAADSLARFGSPGLDVLVGALSHPEMWIRIHAVGALANILDPRAGLILLEMLNDPEREVRKQVIQSLGRLKDPRSARALQEIASNRADRELHALAKQALENIARA